MIILVCERQARFVADRAEAKPKDGMSLRKSPTRTPALLAGAPRLVSRTKPECVRKQKGSENVITVKDSKGAPRGGPNPPGAEPARARLACGIGATALAETVALAFDQGDPISRHLASLPGDLLSWLDPKNVATTGPRLSESEDKESWIDALVTRWEKQRGPIAKEEVMPDEIAAWASSVGSLPNKTGMCKKTKG